MDNLAAIYQALVQGEYEISAPENNASASDILRQKENVFDELLDNENFDETAATVAAMELAAMRYGGIGSADYENRRIQYLLGRLRGKHRNRYHANQRDRRDSSDPSRWGCQYKAQKRTGIRKDRCDMNKAGRKTAPERQLRVAAYCRVANGFDAAFSGLEAQKARLMNEIAAHPEWAMTAIYADVSTGWTLNRRAFKRIIMECRQGEIDVILTSSISRFARDTQDLIRTVCELKRLGVAVAFVQEKINTLEMDTEPLLTVMGAFAQAESENIADLRVCRCNFCGRHSQNRRHKKIPHREASR